MRFKCKNRNVKTGDIMMNNEQDNEQDEVLIDEVLVKEISRFEVFLKNMQSECYTFLKSFNKKENRIILLQIICFILFISIKTIYFSESEEQQKQELELLINPQTQTGVKNG
jgi:hypothetical protein